MHDDDGLGALKTAHHVDRAVILQTEDLRPGSGVFRIELHRAGPIEDTTGALDPELSADEAESWGLVNRVVAPDELLVKDES